MNLEREDVLFNGSFYLFSLGEEAFKIDELAYLDKQRRGVHLPFNKTLKTNQPYEYIIYLGRKPRMFQITWKHFRELLLIEEEIQDYRFKARVA